MAEPMMMGERDPEALVLQYLETGRPDLRDLVIVHYTPMVERIARKFSGIEHVDDLTQVGYIGLLNALTKFDPQAGVRFSTYATHLVTGEIKHYLRDRSQTIRHPAWLQELRHKVNRGAARLTGELGRTPTYLEIAESCGVSEDAVYEVYSTQEMLRVASLDAAPGDDGESESEVDRIEGGMMDAEQMGTEDRLVLEQAIGQLRDLEQQVLILFHFEALSQTEIAQNLGISCNYVSHILRQSLTKLRRILVGEEQREYELAGSPEGKVIDVATGIYSEKYFRSRLQEEVHRVCGSDGVVSVVLFELNGLAAYRSFYGPQSAVELVADAGALLKESVRTLDIVCRHGQSGFGVILPATGSSAKIASERLNRRLESWLMSRTGGRDGMKLFCGYATAPYDSHIVAELLKAAAPKQTTEQLAA